MPSPNVRTYEDDDGNIHYTAVTKPAEAPQEVAADAPEDAGAGDDQDPKRVSVRSGQRKRDTAPTESGAADGVSGAGAGH